MANLLCKISPQFPHISTQIEPFNLSEKSQFVELYLNQYSKKLNANQLQLVIQSNRTNSPLYLKILLEELRVFGSFEELDQKIENLLAAKTVIDLYEMIIERY